VTPHAAQAHRERAPNKIVFGVLTVSDSRTAATDAGGSLARELILAKGYEVGSSRIVPDEVEEIRAAVGDFVEDPSVDVVFLTGGTGISSRDVTFEAVSSLLELRLDGFGEIFRALSHQEIGPAAMLSRAVGGAFRRKPIFAVPGSPKAVRLALEKIVLPEIGHVLAELRR